MCNPRAAGGAACDGESQASSQPPWETVRVQREGGRGGGVRGGKEEEEAERHNTDRMNDASYDCLGQSRSLGLPCRTRQLSSVSQALLD